MSNLEILEQFAPIIYFHPNERYFPVSIDFLLKNSTLKNFLDNTTIEKPSQTDLYSLAEKYEFKPKSDGEIILSIDPYIKYGEHPIKNVPIYAIYRTKNDKIYLTYIILLAHNGDYNILGLANVGSHPGDLEHITLELNKDKQLLNIFYSAHGLEDGRIVKAKDVPMENGKIVAYAALNGHGLYPSEGFAFRFGGIANDYLEKGIRWEPNVFELFSKDNPLFDKNTMGWTVYNGRIGGNLNKPNTEGISGLLGKDWYGLNALSINDFEEKKLKSPPIIPKDKETILFKIKSIILIVLVYLIILASVIITNNNITLFHPTSILNHLIMITIIIFIIISYRIITKRIIKKYTE